MIDKKRYTVVKLASGQVQRLPTNFRIKELTALAAKYGHLALLEESTMVRLMEKRKK